MIIHCVFCNVLDEAPKGSVEQVFAALEDFCESVPGAMSFEYGPNRGFEVKSQDFSDGVVIHFTDKAALEFYAEHPTHKALGAQLCDLCKGGADGIMVFDLDV